MSAYSVLTRLGRPGGPTWLLAYPPRDRLHIGECPLPVDGGRVCGGRLCRVPGQATITCQGCGTAATVDEWESQLYGNIETPIVDAYAGARDLSRRWRREVAPGLIRVWQCRNKVAPATESDPTDPRQRRIVRDERGRTQNGWRHRIGGRGELGLPTAIRTLCGITVGQPVFMAALVTHNAILIHPAHTITRLLAPAHARLLAHLTGGDRHAR
jgi:hypothetical protein